MLLVVDWQIIHTQAPYNNTQLNKFSCSERYEPQHNSPIRSTKVESNFAEKIKKTTKVKHFVNKQTQLHFDHRR